MLRAKARRWPDAHPKTPALDAYILWMVGKMPGECFERVCLRHGRENWLIEPSYHGERCPSNGERPGIECRCDECGYYLECYPDWRDLLNGEEESTWPR